MFGFFPRILSPSRPLIGLLFAFLVVDATIADEPPIPLEPRIAPASTEGSDAIASFRIRDDLTIRLVAAEPLLANPVAFCLDERGRIIVCETFRQNAGVTDNREHGQAWLDDDLAARTVADRVTYHRKHLKENFDDYQKNDDRLRLLEDRDDDGVYESSTVFADRFNSAAEGTGAGVLSYRGTTYFACIPSLWLLRDTNGDAQADEKRSLHYGYGVRVAFRGHDLHGLCLGPDERLYFSVGDRGYHVEHAGQLLSDPESGAVFRCELDGSNLEVFATGLRNPQELAFDDHGNLFTGDNNSDSGDKARWVYVVKGGDTGWRMSYQYLPDRGPFNREFIWHPARPDQPAYIVPPIANFADGPSGLIYYPGVGLPDDFRGRFLLCDFRGGPTNSGVRSFRVRPKGAFFELADQEEPVWNILATDIDFGLDGSLYISDWVNGWNGEGKGRIYRVAAKVPSDANLIQQTKRLLSEGPSGLSLEQLSGLLTHPDRRVRFSGQFELSRRKQTSSLTAAATSGSSSIARLHGIWGLEQIARRASAVRPGSSSTVARPTNSDGVDSITSTLAQLLADSDAEVRAQAARCLGELKATSSAADLVRLLKDDSLRVRQFAAQALGEIGAVESLPQLCQLIAENANRDPILRHGGIMGLAGIAKSNSIVLAVEHSDPAVRLAATVALRKRTNPQVAALLHDPDPQVAVEAARAIHDVPILDAYPKLAAALSRDLTDDAWLRRVLNANYRLGTSEHARAIAECAVDGRFPESNRLDALQMLATWNKPSSRDRVLGMWRPLAERDAQVAVEALRSVFPKLPEAPLAVRMEGFRTAAKLKMQEAVASLVQVVSDDSIPDGQRAQSFEALLTISEDEAAKQVDQLLSDTSAVVRTVALKSLPKTRPEQAVASLEVAANSATTMERQNAIEVLGTIPGVDAARAIQQLLEGISKSTVPNEVHLEILEAAAQRGESQIQQQLSQYQEGRGSQALADSFSETLAGGDANRGRQVFFENTEASCVRCHKVGRRGGEVGPDLSNIASDKDRKYLLEAIVDPNKAIAKGFESVTVVDANGKIHVGVVRSENESTLTLISPDAKTISLEKSSIDERRPAKSPMPEDIVKKLSKRNIRDLVEFLSSRKSSRK